MIATGSVVKRYYISGIRRLAFETIFCVTPNVKALQGVSMIPKKTMNV
jgi:hypothetical protein